MSTILLFDYFCYWYFVAVDVFLLRFSMFNTFRLFSGVCLGCCLVSKNNLVCQLSEKYPSGRVNERDRGRERVELSCAVGQ